MKTNLPIYLLPLLAAACHTSHEHAASAPAHAAHPEHAAHGHEHGADADLKPLMRTMIVHVAGLQTALQAEDLEAARAHATELAEACEGGDEHAHHDLPEAWGPSFVALDKAMHGEAKALRDEVAAGDLAAARLAYPKVAAACQACHAQAPAAAKVGLGRLLEPPSE